MQCRSGVYIYIYIYIYIYQRKRRCTRTPAREAVRCCVRGSKRLLQVLRIRHLQTRTGTDCTPFRCTILSALLRIRHVLLPSWSLCTPACGIHVVMSLLTTHVRIVAGENYQPRSLGLVYPILLARSPHPLLAWVGPAVSCPCVQPGKQPLEGEKIPEWWQVHGIQAHKQKFWDQEMFLRDMSLPNTKQVEPG